MSIKKAFGLALREIRKTKGLTQQHCSTLLNLTQAQWSAYELGKTGIRLEAIEDISQILEIEPLILIIKTFDHLRYPENKTFHLSLEDCEKIMSSIKGFRKRKGELIIKELQKDL